MGAKFQYDESGGTTYYFLAAFVGIVLLPLSYFCWPRSEPKGDQRKLQCYCQPCERKKSLLSEKDPRRSVKNLVIKLALLLGWCCFVILLYKASQVERDWVEYDPWEVLDISESANQTEIKKAYRRMSLIYHPDKPTGDEKMFMRVAKAYAALTDEDTRRNWEEFGNPDGPGAMSFGIALPSWIVDKDNSMIVLGAYVVAFMVILPISVGSWWYKSIKFGTEKILVQTTKLFTYFINLTPDMQTKRLLMILAAAMEFHEAYNQECKIRESDRVEMPPLMKKFPKIDKPHGLPFSQPYAIKAHTLLKSHITRLDLPASTLALDKAYIVKKCPALIQEMITIATQLIYSAPYYKNNIPRLETIEATMKLSQMVVQCLQVSASPLLQLPHFTDDTVRLLAKKKHVRSLRQLACMKDSDRRQLLRHMEDHEYNNVVHFLSNFPLIEMTCRVEVLAEEEKTHITAGSLVTVTINLCRTTLSSLFNKDDIKIVDDVRDIIEEVEEEDLDPAARPAANGKPAWKKPQQKKKPSTKTKKQQKVKKSQSKADKETTEGNDGDTNRVEELKRDDLDVNADVADEASEDEHIAQDNPDYEDDKSWDEIQQATMNKREKAMEGKSKKTHEVHCPFFPEIKQEWWWIYVADRKNHVLRTSANHVVSLVDTEEVRLQFVAPAKLGKYQYQVCLRSDSYFEQELVETIKIEVCEAKKIEDQPQWDISDSENSDVSNPSGSEYETDSNADSDD